MENTAPKKLRNYCYWLITFGMIFIIASLFGNIHLSDNTILSNEKVYPFRLLGIAFGASFCLIPYFVLKGCNWAKLPLYILPIPFLVMGYLLESSEINLELSSLNIFGSSIFIIIWGLCIQNLLRSPEVEEYFKNH